MKNIKVKKIISSLTSIVMIMTMLIYFPNVYQRTNAASQVDTILNYGRSLIGSTAYDGYCQAFVKDCYASAGIYSSPNAGSAYEAYTWWCVSRDASNIPIGAVLYFNTSEYGHAAIYTGNNTMLHGVATVREETISSYYWNRFLGWGFQAGVQPSGVDYVVDDKKPSKPTLSVDAGTAGNKTYFKWNSCSNTTHYDLRVYTGNDNLVYAIGNCSDADAFGTHMMYTDTSHAKALGEGSYYTRVAAVNNETGEYTFSDFVEFTVKAPPIVSTKPSKPTLSIEAGTAGSDTIFNWTSSYPCTHYDLRVYDSNDNIAYAIGLCSDADPFDTHQEYTDTNHKKTLKEGTYRARVAAVNALDSGFGEFTFSDFVEFTVEPASKKDITVTFVTATGNTSTYQKKVVSTNNKYGELPVPEKETGRTFLNWKTANNTIITEDTIVTESKDHYLYANYDYDTWVMYFDARGGTASFDHKTVTYTEKYGELPTATREGYTFKGWKLFYTQNTYLTPDDYVYYINYDTAYAYWTPNEYTVTFNASGGNVSSTSKSVKYNTSYGTLPIPTKSGYEFLGWFDPESGSYITEETTLNINKNHTLYAHWQKEGITGDANNDGIVSVADAVMLQKWLLGSGELTCWQNVDLCKDKRIDVFDMVLLRRLIIENK